MVVVAIVPTAAFACTSAIISSKLNPYGRPILWKHRDTSTTDNKIEYIAPTDSGYGYVALFNATDNDLKEAWIGMNDAGFAVMNTASYNIKNDRIPEKEMDKEGILMSGALRKCRTVEDFADFLQNYPKPMGVEANFGVIDAYGNGAYFETNNYSFVRFDLSDEPSGVLIRTNYSHAGRKGEGYGHIREADAQCLINPYIVSGSITPEILTEKISRTFYHDGRHKDETYTYKKKLLDKDFIPRYKSTATIAIEGCLPIDSTSFITPEEVKNQYIMWVGMGYPPVAEIRAVRCSDTGVPDELKGILEGGRCELGVSAKQKRDDVFTITRGKKDNLVDVSKLYNSQGTGYAQKAIEKNHAIYKSEINSRDGSPDSKL